MSIYTDSLAALTILGAGRRKYERVSAISSPRQLVSRHTPDMYPFRFRRETRFFFRRVLSRFEVSERRG